MSRPMIRKMELSAASLNFLSDISGDIAPTIEVGQEVATVRATERLMTERRSLMPKELLSLGALLRTKPDVVHVRGLGIDSDLPQTPDRYQPSETADVLPSDIPHIALASLLGPAYGIKQIRGGRVLSDVFSRPGFEHKANSAFNSAEALEFHADAVLYPDIRPPVFSLRCLRNPTRTPTIVSSVSVHDLPSRHAHTLQQARYTPVYSDSAQTSLNVPVISGSGSYPTLNYFGRPQVNVELQHQDRYDESLQAFETALQRSAVEVVTEPGDIIFVNNTSLLHARPSMDESAVAPGDRRWQRRLYNASGSTLRAQVAASDTRVLSSRHAA